MGKLLFLVAAGALAVGFFTRAEDNPPSFVEVTEQAGISWTHQAGKTDEKYLIETMGGGGAFLDYDGDGWQDIYLVNSGSHARSSENFQARNALYRNLQNGRFRDVTSDARVPGTGYGMGVAVGDYDSDGDVDLYVTSFGRNILYQNQSDGTFVDVTEQANLAVNLWSTSAAFFDMDNDGNLDLFVCIYLDWDFEKSVYCGDRHGDVRAYCHPDTFQAVPSKLFRNRGDGTFEDVSNEAGINLPGKALGVVTGDINDDGFQDIYVANDAVANFLFVNRGDGTFEENALLSEVAYGSAAKPESGMGTDLGDFNGDGRLDLIVTNIDHELNNLYANVGQGWFQDVTIETGMHKAGFLESGFGVRFFDFDLDGDLDVCILNGHVLDNIEYFKSSVQFKESPILMENRGGLFWDVSQVAGAPFRERLAGRGLAMGDFDQDGDPDLLFVNNNGAPNLLRNDTEASESWIGLRLEGTKSNRDAVGAKVLLKTDRRTLVRHRQGGGSYHSGHDPRVRFGLDADESVESLTITWPSGKRTKVKGLDFNQYVHVMEK